MFLILFNARNLTFSSFFSLKDLFTPILLIWVFCLHVLPHSFSACRCQKRALDSLELELQTIQTHNLSSGRVTSTLNHWAFSLVLFLISSTTHSIFNNVSNLHTFLCVLYFLWLLICNFILLWSERIQNI